jgi:hypothetical protein
MFLQKIGVIGGSEFGRILIQFGRFLEILGIPPIKDWEFLRILKNNLGHY